MTFVWADLTTVAGATAASVLIATVVNILKAVFPSLTARVTGALWSFLGLSVIYAIGAVVQASALADANQWLAWFISWVGALALALGVNTAADGKLTTLVKGD